MVPATQSQVLILVATASALIMFISLGIRSIMGLFVVPISTDLGWGRQSLSLAIAVQNLIWGIINPVVCALGDTKGTFPIVFVGGFIYAAGLAVLAVAGYSFVQQGVIIAGMGLLNGFATAATGNSIILAYCGKRFFPVRGADDKKRLVVFGILAAVAQLGQFVFAPIVQAGFKGFGWRTSMWGLSVTSLLIIPLSLFLLVKSSAEKDDIKLESIPRDIESNSKDESEDQVAPSTSRIGDSAPPESIAESQNVLIEKQRDIKVLTALDRVGTQIVVSVPEESERDKEKEKDSDGPFLTSQSAATLAAIPEQILSKDSTSAASETPATLSADPTGREEASSLREAIFEAVTSRSFIMLSLAFLVCGFHIGFIGTHIPGVATDNGVPASLAPWTLSFIGASSTIGTGCAGYLPKLLKLKVKSVLALIYFSRSILITIFFLTLRYGVKGETASSALVLTFSFFFGFFYLTTIPLTTALVSNIFGTKYLGTLSAITFLGHQVGSFMGSYLGGLEFDKSQDKSLAYCWWASVALGIYAGVMHLIMSDAPHSRGEAPVLVGVGIVPSEQERVASKHKTA
ncbi:hypothetical protein HDU97_004133 [Phlyctochytrium planicorne]|nr:hypothetical protein HDU97_004133 [Phlyctochytrium planicorne]